MVDHLYCSHTQGCVLVDRLSVAMFYLNCETIVDSLMSNTYDVKKESCSQPGLWRLQRPKVLYQASAIMCVDITGITSSTWLKLLLDIVLTVIST